MITGMIAIVMAAAALGSEKRRRRRRQDRDGGSGGGSTIDGVVALPDTATLNCKRWMAAMAKIGGATQVSRDSSKKLGSVPRGVQWRGLAQTCAKHGLASKQAET